jgi:hypothetical protein
MRLPNMKRIFTILLASATLVQLKAQQAPAMPSSSIALAMKKLEVLGSVLYVAAHPDDENTRLLAYLSREKMYRTGYLAITRGDGGQNLIGEEQGVELGLIRTGRNSSSREPTISDFPKAQTRRCRYGARRKYSQMWCGLSAISGPM